MILVYFIFQNQINMYNEVANNENLMEAER